MVGTAVPENEEGLEKTNLLPFGGCAEQVQTKPTKKCKDQGFECGLSGGEHG